MKNRKVKQFNPPLHINPFLTHWTGRKKSVEQAFENLSKIVSTCELKFCSNNTNYPDSEEKLSTSMVCFTDIPIEQALEHCKRYNFIGISFNKQALIGYGANPVLYYVENRRRNQKYLFDMYMRHFDNNEGSSLFSWFTAILQPYDTKILSIENAAEFEEREWRIVRVLPFHCLPLAEQTRGPFNESFQGDIRREQIGTDMNNERFYLKFEKSIIENIVVPIQYQKKAEELIFNNDLDCELILIEE